MSGNDPAPGPRWLRLLWRGVDATVILCGAVLCVLVFGNVLSRFLFSFDIAWSNELAIFAMVWATFLGGVTAQRRGAQMRIGEFVGMLRGRPRRAAEIAINLVVIAVLGALVWYGVIIARRNMTQDMTVLYWPVGLIYAAMPVGALLTAVCVAADTLRVARGGSAEADAAPRE